jgi:hypothetical protein
LEISKQCLADSTADEREFKLLGTAAAVSASRGRGRSTSICRISSTLPFRHKGCWQIDRAALRRVLLDRLDGDETRPPPGLMSALEAKRTWWDGVMT